VDRDKHIENLGAFELLRRRCRVIIASDASADPGYQFGDLGDLIRFARTDLGITIQAVDLDWLRPDVSTGLAGRHAVACEIDYGDGVPGTLLYVKAALTRKSRGISRPTTIAIRPSPINPRWTSMSTRINSKLIGCWVTRAAWSWLISSIRNGGPSVQRDCGGLGSI